MVPSERQYKRRRSVSALSSGHRIEPLGEVLLAQGSKAALEEALAAFREALAVRTPEDLFGPHLESRRNEAAALEKLGRKQEAAAVAAAIAGLGP